MTLTFAPDHQLRCEVDGLVEEYLALDASAAAAYYEFVYDRPERGAAVQRALFERGAAESGAPATRLLVVGGRAAGLWAVLPHALVQRRRLAAAMAVARDPGLRVDDGTAERARLAGRTLVRVQEDDAYLARIAVSPDFAGRGLGGELLERALAEARALGARRCVLDVAVGNTRALALYRRAGFGEVGRAEVTDPVSGRSLGHLHLALPL
jgi:ribosomal protein S18 acetylase RimI-like enzyme